MLSAWPIDRGGWPRRLRRAARERRGRAGPADHFVADEGAFVEALRSGADRRARLPRLPRGGGDRAGHRHGYIKTGEPLHPAHPTALVERFVEKPTAADEADAGRRWLPVERGHLRVAGVRVPGRSRSSSPRWPMRSTRSGRCIGRRAGSWRCATSSSRCRPSRSTSDRRACRRRRTDGGGADGGGLERHRLLVGLLEALSARSGASLVASGQHLDRDSSGAGARWRAAGGHRRAADVIIVDTPDALLVCASRPGRGDQAGPRRDRRKAGERYL